LLETHCPTVLDADALSLLVHVSSKQSERSIPHEKCVLTPHDGEFKRICDVEGDRLKRARAAAQLYRCTVLLKGADTVIAAADGRARINPTAPSKLATAGTGDVLAGMVTGLLAQGLDPFDAASAAAWLHAEAARHCPTPMLAIDLLPFLPDAIRSAETAASADA
jgi:NAD(P)H-hydrate epimerase